MSILVMKFGGAAVASIDQFAVIADMIIDRSKKYSNIVVTISAMGDTTDDLINLAKKVHSNPPRREYDMLVSAGERISMALLAMALEKKGLPAISFTGSQSGIITCENHSNAKILSVKPHRILDQLLTGKIVIVAGFQGVSLSGEITTLGRGGSDTTAVALAAALAAEKVEFFKDVDGIYDHDPKINPLAKLQRNLTYDQALEITKECPQVLQQRCIHLAKKNNILLSVLPFAPSKKNMEVGTLIGYTLPQKRTESPYFE
jgi:aspartate kinase